MSELPLEEDSSKTSSLEEEVPELLDRLLPWTAWEQHMYFHLHRAYDGRSYALPLFKAKNLSLGEEVRLLRAGAESRLLARRLESVRLQNALERLGGRTLAGATATSHGGHINISSRRRFRHFIYYARNFHIERGK